MGLLLKIPSKDYQKIKEKEGYCQIYKEVDVIVREDGSVVKAKTFMVAKELQSKEHQPSSRNHLNLIIEVARNHSFPREYIEKLEKVPVC